MRLVVSMLSLGVLMWSPGCDHRKTASHAEKQQGETAAPRDPAPGRDVAGATDMARPAVRPGTADRVAADSPTGLAVCDRYLKVVCGCAAKDPVLRKACDEGTKSAPKWKETSGKDPEQRKVVSESCRKALDMIKESFGCKP